MEFQTGTTISDKTYTAGARVNQEFTSAADQGLPKLPKVTVTTPEPGDTIYPREVTYSITGLPAGLYMNHDRVIRGIPEAATSEAVTVTYTASVDIDEYILSESKLTEDVFSGSASLTFEVTVNPAVAFGEAATTFLDSKIVTWVDGAWRDAGADGTITFPAASGGTGTITYRLIHNKSQQPLADVAEGITFDTATRKLGGTPAASAQKQWSVRYWAEDENGSRAGHSLAIHAGGWGGL